jgi:CDP-diacylglycerol pyrophosphatase
MIRRPHAVLAAIALIAAGACATADRDALWRIVSGCLDSTAPDYCTVCPAPKADSGCGSDRPCPRTTEVWAKTDEYVAIRDAKSCGCPPQFVHGLALPRERVTGLEDAKRPDGLWQFAWATAEQRIKDRSSIALIVNPRAWRTQNQLHVHILRLRGDARMGLAGKVAHLQSLASTWVRAAELADAASLREHYGVLVMLDPAGGYLLYVAVSPLEYLYAQGWCK